VALSNNRLRILQKHCFFSMFAVETELKAKTLVAVVVREIDIRRELKIVHRKDKHLSRAARTFIEMCPRQLTLLA
jgi:hypothetical protein